MTHTGFVRGIVSRASAVLCVCAAVLCPSVSAQDVLRSVNPFIGTGAHGHTFPGATVPFGMVQLSPDTRVEGWDACGGYHYSDSTILGFSHTHLSGTGVPDYGDVLVLPVAAGTALVPPGGAKPGGGARAAYRHEDERAMPGYYDVTFRDTRVRAELTATLRTGFHRYTFPRGSAAALLVDLQHGLGPDRARGCEFRLVSDTEAVGLRRSAGWAKDQQVFFVMRFSRPVVAAVMTDFEHESDTRALTAEKGLRARLEFRAADGAPLLVKVALSGVDVDGARKNLEAENPGWDFDATREAAAAAWRKELRKIEITGGSETQRAVFYTALYHSMVAPNVWSDIDGRYRGMDGKVYTAEGWTMYTVFSLWDTFRALHPLLSIIDRARTRDFVRSMVAKGREARVLPVWELAANETWCMIGYHSVPVIVDAAMKGITDFDMQTALALMKQGATADRFGLRSYNRYGFIPGDDEGESVSKTLEYAYDDWCISAFAQSLGFEKDAAEYARRAQGWKHLFDPGTGFMRPRINGGWAAPFDPSAVTNHYTEANPWQYSFFVPQDVDGLIRALGGDAAFVRKLDTLFTTASSLAGREQSDITGMIGQYAQGNEPSHHAAYLYAYAGEPRRTQQLARKIMDSLFHNTPEGICGNDDCGQMSAWYVMSALGVYQVCPGRTEYVLGSPLFPEARINLENGRTFTMRMESKNHVVRRRTLNGQEYAQWYLDHAAIEAGGTFVCSDAGNDDEGLAAPRTTRPHSSMQNDALIAPAIVASAASFRDSLSVTVANYSDGAELLVATVENPGPADYRPYRGPITLRSDAVLSAYTQKDGRRSGVVRGVFTRHVPAGTVRINTPYQAHYAAGGDQALVDGVRGRADFRLGGWQGWEENDLDVTLDLGARAMITAVGLSCVQDHNAWIFFPRSVTFAFSTDGVRFNNERTVMNTVPEEKEGALMKIFEMSGTVGARYVRVTAKNVGRCPAWHKGAGGKAWIFADEIIISKRKQ